MSDVKVEVGKQQKKQRKAHDKKKNTNLREFSKGGEGVGK